MARREESPEPSDKNLPPNDEEEKMNKSVGLPDRELWLQSREAWMRKYYPDYDEERLQLELEKGRLMDLMEEYDNRAYEPHLSQKEKEELTLMREKIMKWRSELNDKFGAYYLKKYPKDD